MLSESSVVVGSSFLKIEVLLSYAPASEITGYANMFLEIVVAAQILLKKTILLTPLFYTIIDC